MDTTLTPTATPALADIIPADVLAKAARLALDTLVSILNDAKAAANERRIAALAILRLAFPTRPRAAQRSAAPLERARSASEGSIPAHETAPPTPGVSPPADHPKLADGRGFARPARHLAAAAGSAPMASTPPPRSAPSRPTG